MAPVVAELRRRHGVEARVAATAQHREMLDQALEVFDILPDHDLNVMTTAQSPTEVLAIVALGLQPILREFAPDWVLVQGDTTTVLAAAIAAAYAGSAVGHVEAGLRTYDRQNPFPEETNRVLVDHVSALHFAPTELCRQALIREGISDKSIHVTGNTVVDALRFMATRVPQQPPPEHLPGKRLILVTAHRRENHGRPLRDICAALRQLATRPDVQIVYPVHKNPQVWNPVHELLGGIENVTLTEPLDYLKFIALMAQAYFVLTDSGGIQEEAPSLGVPVLVLRQVTERPEAIAAGGARLVGTDPPTIVAAAQQLLDDSAAYAAMAQVVSPFGDGNAARRIVDVLVGSNVRAMPEANSPRSQAG